MTESEATIFYDPTRYMVKWSIDVEGDKPEYLLVNVKRGLTDSSSDALMADEDASRYSQLRIRKNASGKYDGSAILKYQNESDIKYYYSLEVIGARDDSGHDILFANPIVSLGKENGTVSCDKPVTGPTTPVPADGIKLAISLTTLTLDANGGKLDDETPEKIWAEPNTTVTIPSGYVASRVNYTYFGWGETPSAGKTDVITSKNVGSEGATVYAILLDTTPPEILIGEYANNDDTDKSTNPYYVPVTVTDAVSTENILYYAFYDTNPGEVSIDDQRWESATKKTLSGHSSTEKAKFKTESVIYMHVKAVDASGNASVASKEIRVDIIPPVIRAYPNVDSFCATDVVIDVTDNSVVPTVTIKKDGDDFNPTQTPTSAERLVSFTLAKPASGYVVYTITAKDAANNETVRTITIYAAHDWDNGTIVRAVEPTETNEGYYLYKKCAHCEHIILLHGNPNKPIDITNETSRGEWIIPKGSVLIMAPYDGALDIIDHKEYVNDALNTTNTLTSAEQVRITKDTKISGTTASGFTIPSRSIDLELNGHGLLLPSGIAGSITGNDYVTILLTDNGTLPYTNKSPISNASPVKYVRSVSAVQAQNWQALYLPAGFSLAENDDYEVAQLVPGFTPETEGDGSVVLRIETMSSGDVAANKPYWIRAKQEGAQTLKINLTPGLPAAQAWDDCETGTGYTFSGGTMMDSPVSAADNPFWVMLNNGTMWYAKAGQTQRPYRWVIQPTGAGAKTFSFVVVEPEADAIEEVEANSEKEEQRVFTLDGRSVPSLSHVQRGIYIVNGKKMVVK